MQAAQMLQIILKPVRFGLNFDNKWVCIAS